MSEQTKSQFPTEMVDIPSQGKLYPKEHPFSSGKVEMRYMTATVSYTHLRAHET